MNDTRLVRVGSRQSQLALLQTSIVIKILSASFPNLSFQIIPIITLGDKKLEISLDKIGEKGLFTKELETALLDGSVDFVVHSLKDMQTSLPEGLVLAATTKREDPRDAIVLSSKLQSITSLSQLPPGSVIGTSSIRRLAQLKSLYTHLSFMPIRGNMNLRLKKLDESSEYTGVVMAMAAINRLGWQHRSPIILDAPEMLYAVGQGALGIECRLADKMLLQILGTIDDPNTRLSIEAERSLMSSLEGGCSVPIGVHCSWTGDVLGLTGRVLSADGIQKLECFQQAQVDSIQQARLLGQSLAKNLLSMGAHNLLQR